jgi:L-arabinose transport system substrate-binding protein
MKKTLKIMAVIMVLVFTMSISLSGCGSAPAAADTAKTTDTVKAAADTVKATDTAKKIKIGYICKMLTHPWFMEEEKGMKDKAAALGADFVSIDANLKDEPCMAAVDSLITQKVDAIAITATNQGLGPAIAKKLKDAGIALCTTDDPMKDDAGKPIPHIGFAVRDLAMQGGEALGKIANDRGWFKDGNVVKVMQIDVPGNSVIHERTLGYQDALKKTCPQLKDSDFIVQASPDGMYDKNLPVASAILNANPKVTHWIVTGINDDGALAPIKIFQEAKFNMDNVIACAFGGYELAQAEFEKGSKSIVAIGMPAYDEGALAMQTLYDNVVNKKPMPEMSAIPCKLVTPDTYKDYYANKKK